MNAFLEKQTEGMTFEQHLKLATAALQRALALLGPETVPGQGIIPVYQTLRATFPKRKGAKP